jgi:release factor glutamine methyltransferase
MLQTVQDALRHSNDVLAEAGIETARLDARLLVGHVLGMDAKAALLVNERALHDAEQERLKTLLARRAGHEPMAYIMAEREFWSLPFKVTPATLVPRPDSETIVEAVLASVPDRQKHFSILDLGTGSGCLLLSLLHELPQAQGVGIDCSTPALNVARDNAQHLQLSNRASFICADWGNGVSKKFDLIVCNPPYIPHDEIKTLMPDVAQFEPRHALSGGKDGLESYRAIASCVPDMLKKDGTAYFEIGMNQADAVINILTENRLQTVDIKEDLSGLPRCIVAELSRA